MCHTYMHTYIYMVMLFLKKNVITLDFSDLNFLVLVNNNMPLIELWRKLEVFIRKSFLIKTKNATQV